MIELALIFFFVTNPLGNVPTILTLIKNFSFERQRIILFREGILSLLVALFFQYFGKLFLSLLHIECFAVTITGGIILTILAINMMFNPMIETKEEDLKIQKQEPFLVPIATPILSGPGLLAVIMLKSDCADPLKVTGAIIIAWIGVLGILVAAPYLNLFLGKRGLAAFQQVMGMLLALVSIQMIVNGTSQLIKHL